MSKNTKENSYNKFNYVAKNITINRIIKNSELLKILDIDKLHLKNKKYDLKIK